MSKAINEMFDSVMQNINSMVGAEKIIGEAITAPDGTIIIPVSQVSFGFGGGGADFDTKNDAHFGGGMGCGVKVTPNSFLVINNSNVRLISAGGSSSPLDKVIDLVPDMVDKVNSFFTNKGKESAN